jgi:hypothetical protein
MKKVETILYIEFADFISAGWNDNALKSNNYRNGPYWQMIADPADKRKVLVKYDTLRKKDKDKLGDTFGNPYLHLAAMPLLKMLPDVPEDAKTYYYNYKYNGDNRLPDTHINQCLRYVQWLLLLKRFIGDKTIKKEIKTELGLRMDEFGKTMQALINKDQDSGRIGKKHAASWVKLTKNVKLLNCEKASANGRQGYEAFIDSNFGNDNSKIVTDDVVDLLNNLFRKQQHKPTPSEVADQYLAFKRGEMDMVINDSGEILNPDDYPEISHGTVLHWLRKWELKAPASAIRTGNRQLFIQEQIPSHKKYSPLYSGSKLSIDDRQPPFEYGPSQRAWFYMAQDLCSKAWTCWVHGKTKEELIQNFYRQLVRNYSEWGIKLPYELECEMSLNSQFQTTMLADGAMFGKVNMIANMARGKRIEREFRDMRYGDEREDEGWIARPFARSESYRAAPKKTDQDKPKFIPYNTIIERSLGHIANWNNAEHPKHRGMSRWEVFMTMQHPSLQPINWRSILPHIGYSTRTSVNAGQALLQGGEWLMGNNGAVSTGPELINYLKAVNNKDIIMQWLDGNNGEVLQAHVCTIDGRFICEAIKKPGYNTAVLEQTEEDNASITILSKYVATVTGFINENKKKSEAVTVIDNRPKFKPSTIPFIMPGSKTFASTESLADNLGDAYDLKEKETVQLPACNTSWRQKFLKN